jgi:predicted RNA binding protein YcfA (HicA-like mRNA interferase family)
MKPIDTKRVRRALRRRGCFFVGTEGSHEKWQTPGGLAVTIVAAEKEQSPGLLRVVQQTFERELGAGWLEKELKR